MARNAIVIDLDRCIGCFGCEVACKQENSIDLGQYWSKVKIEGPFGTFPDIEQYWLPVMCQQCEDAPCINVCPVGASYRNDEGVVLVDTDACIGCRLCMDACPYGVRAWNPAKNAVEKCTLCEQRRAKGEKPACVAACCGDARLFGDLDDPASDVARALAAADPSSVHALTDVGNRPLTRYILSEKIATWRSDA